MAKQEKMMIDRSYQIPVIDAPVHDTIEHGAVTDVEAIAVYHPQKEEAAILAVNRNLAKNPLL